MTTCASGHVEQLAAIALIELRADRPRSITLAADKACDTGDRSARGASPLGSTVMWSVSS
jgi:hypothetical protein